MDLDQRLTRLRAPLAASADGTLSPNWGALESAWDKVDYWCSFQPVGTREDLVAQDRTETDHIAEVVPDADITSADRIRYKGQDYTVDGEPLDFSDTDLYADEAHYKVFCKQIRGG